VWRPQKRKNQPFLKKMNLGEIFFLLIERSYLGVILATWTRKDGTSSWKQGTRNSLTNPTKILKTSKTCVAFPNSVEKEGEHPHSARNLGKKRIECLRGKNERFSLRGNTVFPQGLATSKAKTTEPWGVLVTYFLRFSITLKSLRFSTHF